MTRGKTYRVEAVIDLPAVLLLGSDFPGILKPAVIGGVEVHVVLPDFNKSGTETVLHPRAKVDWVGSFEGKESEDDPGWPFGRVFGRGAEREFSATRLLVLPRERLTLRQARDLHGAAEDWVRSLVTWTEVVTREDLHRQLVKVDKSGEAVYVWVERGMDPDKVLKGNHTITFDFSGRSLAISPRQWGRILARASEDARPPEAHVFLRDARHAKNSGLYRRSVLDSATAAELSLAKLRDDRLSGTDRRLAAYVRREVRQLNGLTEFLKAMDQALPSGIKSAINEPRNKAIHQGHAPSKETAGDALQKAEELVDLAFPWKKLLLRDPVPGP